MPEEDCNFADNLKGLINEIECHLPNIFFKLKDFIDIGYRIEFLTFSKRK